MVKTQTRPRRGKVDRHLLLQSSIRQQPAQRSDLPLPYLSGTAPVFHSEGDDLCLPLALFGPGRALISRMEMFEKVVLKTRMSSGARFTRSCEGAPRSLLALLSVRPPRERMRANEASVPEQATSGQKNKSTPRLSAFLTSRGAATAALTH
jgi:hypothetical protein